MSLDALERRDVVTPQGVIPLWGRPGAVAGSRPVLLAITAAFAGPDVMSKLPQVAAPVADAFVMRLPGNGTPGLADATVAGIAAAVDALIAQMFANRPVAVLGIEAGGLVALALRAPQVRRLIAIEPPLANIRLWPMSEGLRARLAAQPDAATRDLIAGVFGVDETTVRDLQHMALLDGLDIPTEVIVGQEPLMPARALGRLPSLVDLPERQRLAAHPSVRLRQAPQTGHGVVFQAPTVVRDAIFAACEVLATPTVADAVLLAATPPAARRLLHLGPGGLLFAEAYRRRNPKAEIVLQSPGAGDDGGYDAVVLGGDLIEWGAASAAAVRLAPGGVVIGAASAGAGVPPAPGLTRLPPIGEDTVGRQAVRLRQGPASPPLRLQTTIFAPTLMDIRTRLPAQGMQADPEMHVTYGPPPMVLPQLPRDQPRVVVMQRPALVDTEGWRQAMAQVVARGWLAVMEYDDHPELVAEVKNRTLGDPDWRRFSYLHAVQTSTPRLKAVFDAWNPEVAVFPNAVFDLPPFPAEPRPARVFYGAVSRGGFAVEVARSLAPATARFPDAEFVVIGDRTVFEALPTARKVFHDYTSYDGYLALMADCTISLSPIEGRRHQDTKSDAKFLDAARGGVLTIASPTIYAEVIAHGVNGLIAEQVADWSPLLAQALGDDAARRTMARRAWEDVRRTRMFADQVAVRRDWYRGLWDRREALNTALMDRLPGLAEAVAALRP